MLYAITNHNEGHHLIKIGYSNGSYHARINDYYTANPLIHFVNACAGSREEETILHDILLKEYGATRIFPRSEWFDVDKKLYKKFKEQGLQMFTWHSINKRQMHWD